MRVVRLILKGLIFVSFLILLLLFLPRVLGIKTYAVTSGSMEPTLPVGALIWIREKKEIQVGDIITFRLGESVVTHRVEKLQAESYVTRGDANEYSDLRAVKKEQILGTVWFRIPYLGFLSMALGTAFGKMAAIALFLWMLCLEAVAEEITFQKVAPASGTQPVKQRGRRKRGVCKNGQKKMVDIGSAAGSLLVCSGNYRSVHDSCAKDIGEYHYAGKY